jgi:hypothetical protein
MTEIQYVTVQIVRPCGSYPYGKIEEGFYRVEGAVVLVTRTGAQRYDAKKKPIRQKLKDGENARSIAWHLTKQHMPNRNSGFNRPLRYFDPGKI